MRWKALSYTQKTKIKAEKIQKWHEWFAWKPVFVGNEKVWFETVYRKAKNVSTYTDDRFFGIFGPTVLKLSSNYSWEYSDIINMMKDKKDDVQAEDSGC